MSSLLERTLRVQRSRLVQNTEAPGPEFVYGLLERHH